MGKKKTVQTNEPWGPSQPYILKNLQQQDEVFNQQQPTLNKYSQMQMDSYGRIAPGAEQGILAAQGAVNDSLAGKYLSGNPYIDGIISKTRENITNDVGSAFSGAGRYGSDYHTGEMTRQLADAENNLRFQNYGLERGYMQDNIGNAQNMMGGAQGLLNNAAELPWIGVQAANGAVRNASGGYGTQTTTQKQGVGGLLAGIAGAGLSGWAGGGFG